VSVTSAEYKQVTVLFADVVHSMDIAATVGAERLREIMTELVTHAAAGVQRYGGTVDKFTGDGIMAVFGAPAALEDHALRACLAGLGIRANLALRVGLDSSQVIAGEIVSAATGYTAIGEQVGMAQRMESVAPPGAVMLSDSTARLVKGVARLGGPQLVHIKGADSRPYDTGHGAGGPANGYRSRPRKRAAGRGPRRVTPEGRLRALLTRARGENAWLRGAYHPLRRDAVTLTLDDRPAAEPF
jgi:adenylate cyclase